MPFAPSYATPPHCSLHRALRWSGATSSISTPSTLPPEARRTMIRAEHLTGKPAPDMFLMAAKLLGVDPTRAVVIEDAISGVRAGSNGNFGLVIGVARKGNAKELRNNGAHLVVNDLGELID